MALGLTLAVTLAGSLTCLAPAVRADDGGLSKYAGTYAYSKDEAHAEAILEKAMDEALEASDLNTVMKLMFKKAFVARSKFIDKVLIETGSGDIGLKFGDMEKVVLPPDKPTKMKRDGREGTVTHSFKNGKVVVKLDGDDGTIVTTLTLDKDGKTLHRDVVVNSPRLKKAIKYRLTYTRK